MQIAENLSKLLASASKLVLLMFSLTACIALFTKQLDPKDFMVLGGMVFGYYFAHKGDPVGK